MVQFLARRGVEALFGKVEFGPVEGLDIGEYEDPSQFGETYYVFRIQRRQDVIRWRTAVDAKELEGKLDRLRLSSPDGASYEVEAVCTAKRVVSADRFEYVFEAQLPPVVVAPAQQRHGVDSLAAALLLDALGGVKRRDDPER
jgi:hypothetical protein